MKMKLMAFVSRHVPTPEQVALAAEQDYKLIHVGDTDAFTPDLSILEFIDGQLDADAVAVVHPWLALECLKLGYDVAVFENANRAPEGEKPQFYAKALHIQGRRK